MVKNAKHFGVNLLVIVFILGALLLSSCADKSSALTSAKPMLAQTESSSTGTDIEPSQTAPVTDEAEATPLSIVTPPPTVTVASEYEAVGMKIIHGYGNIIYDATPYYKDVKYTAITDLVDDGEALYFVEAGLKEEYDPSAEPDVDPKLNYAIVRIDYDGQNRQELLSKYDQLGYTNLTAFCNRLFYNDEVWAGTFVRDVSKDGKEQNVIDWKAYAERTGGDASLMWATFTQDNDYLYVHIIGYEGGPGSTEREVRIDKNMALKDMPLKEDQYLVSASKLTLISKETGKKSVIYDASNYYADDAVIEYYQTTNDMFVLKEISYNDDGETGSSIVTIDKQGKNRNVLTSINKDYWYQDLFIYQVCVVFVENRKDTRQIGYVPLTGGEVKYIGLTSEQQKDIYNRTEFWDDHIRIKMIKTNDNSEYAIYVDENFHVFLVG